MHGKEVNEEEEEEEDGFSFVVSVTVGGIGSVNFANLCLCTVFQPDARLYPAIIAHREEEEGVSKSTAVCAYS